MYSIYHLTNSQGIIFYVGMTKNPMARLSKHRTAKNIQDAKRYAPCLPDMKMDMVVLETCNTEDEAIDREHEVKCSYIRSGLKLTNFRATPEARRVGQITFFHPQRLLKLRDLPEQERWLLIGNTRMNVDLYERMLIINQFDIGYYTPIMEHFGWALSRRDIIINELIKLDYKTIHWSNSNHDGLESVAKVNFEILQPIIQSKSITDKSLASALGLIG